MKSENISTSWNSCLDEIREHIDQLELIVDDQMWTLPKYRELLFIR